MYLYILYIYIYVLLKMNLYMFKYIQIQTYNDNTTFIYASHNIPVVWRYVFNDFEINIIILFCSIPKNIRDSYSLPS